MSSFSPHQIVCLSCLDSKLYAEVIQIIVDRSSIWVRPWLFLSGENQDPIDIRESSDVILPIALFRPALDTEVLPIFSQIVKNNPASPSPYHLQNFIRQICQTYPEYFSKSLG